MSASWRIVPLIGTLTAISIVAAPQMTTGNAAVANRAAHPTPHWVVAVSGNGHALYANRPGHLAMHNLGGTLIGPPAVTAIQGRAIFVADLKSGGLSVRSIRHPWVPLVTGGFTCTQPEVTSLGDRFGVACLRHHHVYAARTTVASGLPVVRAMHNQGGDFSIGPSVYFVTKQGLQLGEVGKPYNVGSAHHNTYFRQFQGANGFLGDNQLRCVGPQTNTSTEQYDVLSVYGCVGHRDGHDNRLAINFNDDNGFSPVDTAGRSRGGRIGLTFGSPSSEDGGTYLAYTDRRGRTVVRTIGPVLLHHAPGPALVIYRHAHGGAAITSW